MSKPYTPIPSPRTTKISALPNALGSSEVAPIAAGAAPATAIPAAIQAAAVGIAIPISPRPFEEAAAASCAASSAPAAPATRGNAAQHISTAANESN